MSDGNLLSLQAGPASEIRNVQTEKQKGSGGFYQPSRFLFFHIQYTIKASAVVVHVTG